MNLFQFVTEFRTVLYWRGPETTALAAEKSIEAAGFTCVFCELLKVAS